MSVLESSARTIIACEAVLDALTLIQMGWTNTVALIGTTSNYRATDQIGASGKNVAFGFDWDDNWEGQRAVGKNLVRWRHLLRHPGTASYFTRWFRASLPAVEQSESFDFNKWYMDHGHRYSSFAMFNI